MINYGQQPGDVYRDPGTPSSMNYYPSPRQPQNQNQYQHQQHQPQQAWSYDYSGEGASSPHSRGVGRDMPRGYHDESQGANMAGFAARKFAIKKQEETLKRQEFEQKKRQDELNWKRAEEAYHAERERKLQQHQIEEELKRRAEEERQGEERRWADRRGDPRGMQYQQEQVERQRAEDRWQQRSQAMASSSSPLIRSNEKPLPAIHNTPRRPTLREMRSQSKRSISSNLAHQTSFKQTTTTSNGQMSASPSTAFSNHSAYSGLVTEPTTDFGNSTEEEADEDLTIQPDGFGGMMKVQKRIPTTPQPLRESALMLAKCADCGLRFSLDKLDGHSCISSSIFSHSAPVTPMDENPPEITRCAPSRSPFMEKYAQLVEDRTSPILCDTKLKPNMMNSFPSPAMKGSPDSNASNDGLTCLAETFKAEEERQRSEKVRRIQEQRAAKKMQSRSPAINKSTGTESKNTFSPTLHNRDPASISSSSGSSLMSSLFGGSSVHAPQSDSDNLTPSSSVESVEVSLYNDRVKKQHLPKKSMDIGGIENLLQDIHTDGHQRVKGTGLGISTGMATSQSHQGRPSAAELKARLQKKTSHKTCHHCHQVFKRGQAMAEKDGFIYCIDDYAELFLEKCGKCRKPVRDVGIRSQDDDALSGIYHRDCFSCFTCHSIFQDGTFYIYENAPYCSQHYHRVNGTNCHSCKKGIEGKCRQMESGEKFHPRCLTCQYDNGKEFCKDVLTDYYLIKGKRLCEWHYEKVERYLEQKGISKAAAAASSYKRRTIMRNVEAKRGRA